MNIIVNVAGQHYRVLAQQPTTDPAVDTCTLVKCRHDGTYFTSDKIVTLDLEVTW